MENCILLDNLIGNRFHDNFSRPPSNILAKEYFFLVILPMLIYYSNIKGKQFCQKLSTDLIKFDLMFMNFSVANLDRVQTLNPACGAHKVTFGFRFGDDAVDLIGKIVGSHNKCR